MSVRQALASDSPESGHNRAQLEQLSQYVPSASALGSPLSDAKDIQMEIDSTASTPGAA